MCGPKPPRAPSTQTEADPELARQRREAELANAEAKAELKEQRTQDKLALLMGRIGRRSLFSGGQGGQGYAAPRGRSLFLQSGHSFARGVAALGKYQPGARIKGGSIFRPDEPAAPSPPASGGGLWGQVQNPNVRRVFSRFVRSR